MHKIGKTYININEAMCQYHELGKGKYSDQGNKVIPRDQAPRGYFIPEVWIYSRLYIGIAVKVSGGFKKMSNCIWGRSQITFAFFPVF